MKNILGLDLGTNSIGWCVVSKDDDNRLERIEGIGSRIIPMSQDILGNFAVGNSVSQTAERTAFRSVRRLRERHLLRRERLLRILHLIGFLPEHYDASIGWDKTDHRTFAKFKNVTEPKIAWKTESSGDRTFIFEDTFKEMLAEFMREQPELVKENTGKKIRCTIKKCTTCSLNNNITDNYNDSPEGSKRNSDVNI